MSRDFHLPDLASWSGEASEGHLFGAINQSPLVAAVSNVPLAPTIYVVRKDVNGGVAAGGGGGGAGAVGGNGTAAVTGGGAGGAGASSDITGASLVYAAGGGGSSSGAGTAGVSGAGGANNGGAGAAGANGRGGGGGGAQQGGSDGLASGQSPGGRGGDGVVVLRWPTRVLTYRRLRTYADDTVARADGRVLGDYYRRTNDGAVVQVQP